MAALQKNQLPTKILFVCKIDNDEDSDPHSRLDLGALRQPVCGIGQSITFTYFSHKLRAADSK